MSFKSITGWALPGLVFALALVISGCGKKGPLTLPDNAQAAISQPAPAQVNSARIA